MSYYHYLYDGSQNISPPQTEAELRELLRTGKLTPDVLCAQEGWTDWRPLGQVFPDAVVVGTGRIPSAPAGIPASTRTDGDTSSPSTASIGFRPKPRRRWLMESVKLLFVTGCGLSTSLTLGAILAAIEIYAGFALYSFTLWFVIPVGAIGAGFGAVAGCYYAARWVHYYPRFLFFISSVAIATGTLAAIHFMVWSASAVEGVPLREQIGYLDYLQWVAHNSSIVIKQHTDQPLQLGETGSLIYFAIQTLGFTIGGLCLFGVLRGQPYCHESNTYKQKSGLVELYDRSPQGLENQVKIIKTLLGQGHFHDAITKHPSRESLAARGYIEGARSVITFYKSKESPTTTLRHQVFVCTGKNEWKEIDGLAGDYEATGV